MLPPGLSPLPGPGGTKPPNPALVGLAIVGVLGLLFLVPALFVFTLVAMLPTLAMFFRNRSGDLTDTQILGAMNLAGTLPFLVQVWKKGNTFQIATGLLLQPSTLFLIGLAAAAGGLLIWAGPVAAARTQTFTNKREAEALLRQNDDLVKLWGEELEEDADRMRMGRYED